MTTASAFPLQWPDHIPRWSGERKPGAFKATLHSAMENVSTSLRLFGVDSGKPVSAVVYSSNVTLGINRPRDPGVAVWFTWEGVQICIPVDRYSTPEANVQAIHHILEARRTELRHGTLALVRATFQGFRALPSPPSKPWREILAFPADRPATRDNVETAYRMLARERHPDAGGSDAKMAELNTARDAALKEIGNG
ncbi:MAG: J domain-containing protein [Alphaproteobacteria bacterium]|nr:J domain-containing protein [Alphaproteobacteria bacterium]